ncbi:hypothetical protein Tco_0365983 [Tanacetum coccineum]
MLDFKLSAVQLTSPERNLQNALIQSRSFRDDVHGSLFQQSGSASPLLRVTDHLFQHSFSTAGTNAGAQSHAVGAACQGSKLILTFVFRVCLSFYDADTLSQQQFQKNVQADGCTKARNHAFNTASQRGFCLDSVLMVNKLNNLDYF